MPERTVLLNPKTECYHPDRRCSRLLLTRRGTMVERTFAELPPGAWPCSYCYSKAGMARQRGERGF